jgi:Suppressor of fused protein (SUFU)
MTQDLVRKHYRDLWGEPSRVAEHIFKSEAFEIWKWAADRTTEKVALYATIGASAWPLPASPFSHRFELFLGLQPAEDEVAMALAGVASFPFRTGKQLAPGHTVTFPDMPLWPTTSMQTFLVRRPREPIIPTLRGPEGLHVEFWQVLPLHGAELDFHRRHGPDALLERWEAAGVPFWDPRRPAAPLAPD